MTYSAASEAKINLRFESNTDGIEKTKKSWQSLLISLKDTSAGKAAQDGLSSLNKYAGSIKTTFIELGTNAQKGLKNIALKGAAEDAGLFSKSVYKLSTVFTEVGESAAKAGIQIGTVSGKTLGAAFNLAPIIAFGGGFNDLGNGIATASGALNIFSNGGLKLLTRIGMETPGIIAVA